jgi:hypothetical protein
VIEVLREHAPKGVWISMHELRRIVAPLAAAKLGITHGCVGDALIAAVWVMKGQGLCVTTPQGQPGFKVRFG